MDWRDFFLKRGSKFFVSWPRPFLRRDARRDGISGHVEVISADEDHVARREDSSRREKDWKRLSWTRSRRAGTLLGWRGRRWTMYLRSCSTYGCHASSIRATRFIANLLALEPWETTSKCAHIGWADRSGWQPQEATRIPFTENSPDRRLGCPIKVSSNLFSKSMDNYPPYFHNLDLPDSVYQLVCLFFFHFCLELIVPSIPRRFLSMHRSLCRCRLPCSTPWISLSWTLKSLSTNLNNTNNPMIIAPPT